MKARLVARENVLRIADLLAARGYEVVAPFRARGRDTVFDLVTPANRETIALHLPNPYYPPKRFVLPHIQRLMTLRRTDGRISVEPAEETRKLAVFGIRSCDLVGIQHLDRFYLGRDYRDINYERLREGLFTVNMACTDPDLDIGPDCFCVCADTGPAARGGFDLQLVDLGDEYMAVAGSPQGEALFSEPIFVRAEPDHVRRRREVLANARRSFRTNTSWFSAAVRAVTTGTVTEQTWEEIGRRCLECGGCTFVCPACTCFTVTDRATGPDTFERVRVWDSCALDGFTRMAGGFNPRRAVHDRRNRRFFRKLSHYFVQRELNVACVGCGRCAAVCHGDIGMPSVVEMLRRASTDPSPERPATGQGSA
ncbi:MAG: sulfite reductase [Armatimonadetes bacterium]|nr:sulfite reductase [Armatimonadota bacterium]